MLCGTKDTLTPPWQSQRIADAIPGAQVWWLPGAGHMLNWESPDAIVEAVSDLSATPAR